MQPTAEAGASRTTTTGDVRRTSPLRAAIAGSVAGKSVEMVTLVLLATVVPRALGPSDFGRFSIALTIVTIGSLAMTLGGPAVMTRFVPAVGADQRVPLARALGERLARGRLLQLAIIAAGAALIVAIAPSRVRPYETLVVVVALALNVVATLVLQVSLGLGRTGPWSARYPLQNAVLVVLVVLLHRAFGVDGAVAAIVPASAIAVGLALVTTVPLVAGAGRWSGPLPPGAIRFGAFQAAGAALVQFTHRGGVLAVALLDGSDAESGRAALAIGIALGATYAILQMFTVSLPHLAARTVDGSAEAVLRRLALGILVPVAGAAAVVALLADRIVPKVFGDEFAAAAPAFGPALAVMTLAPVSSLLVQVTALRLRPVAALAGGATSAIVFCAVALVAVPAWGAEGATFAALCGVAAGALVTARLVPGGVGWPLGLASAVACATVAGFGVVGS